jgi:hypothetical protein
MVALMRRALNEIVPSLLARRLVTALEMAEHILEQVAASATSTSEELRIPEAECSCLTHAKAAKVSPRRLSPLLGLHGRCGTENDQTSPAVAFRLKALPLCRDNDPR